MRIAFAGFQHETNTFAPGCADLAAFEMADTWPPLLRGAAVLSATRGMNLPIAGALAEAEAAGVAPAPVLWCAAEPSGPVTDAAFDRIAGEIVAGVMAAGPLNGVYLDLHGAMVTESHVDGEAELLARLRAALDPDVPVGVSFDLHANISPQMVDLATVMTVFRTYPHLDMAETGARCLRLLCHAIRVGAPARAFCQMPFLVPLPAQHTGSEPARELYAAIAEHVREPDESADIALGFTAADVPDCGPSVVAYAGTEARADEIADALAARLAAAEATFETELLSPDAAVRDAMRLTTARPAAGPVVIADVQDNPGAGGTSDTTGLLFALARAGARGAIVALLHDPVIAAEAHAAGAGAVLDGPLGGRSGLPGEVPFPGPFRVMSLSDGHFAYSGEMYGGGHAEIGPCCVLSAEPEGAEIHILVSSVRSQCLDLAQLRHIGLEPRDARILCAKSTVHFRADFEPIAATVLVAAAPGAFPCRLSAVDYRNLRPGMRIAGSGAGTV